MDYEEECTFLEIIQDELADISGYKERYRYLNKEVHSLYIHYQKISVMERILNWFSDHFHFAISAEPGGSSRFYETLKMLENGKKEVEEAISFMDKELDRIEKKYKLGKTRIFLLLFLRNLLPFRKRYVFKD